MMLSLSSLSLVTFTISRDTSESIEGERHLNNMKQLVIIILMRNVEKISFIRETYPVKIKLSEIQKPASNV